VRYSAVRRSAGRVDPNVCSSVHLFHSIFFVLAASISVLQLVLRGWVSVSLEEMDRRGSL
jgi:hypothetical protein